MIPRDEDGHDGVSSGMYGTYYSPDDGSITDGDDHVWIGDPGVLMSGEWRDFDIQGMLGKQPRSVMSTSVGDGLSSSAEQDMNEIHEQLNDPEDSDLEHEVCQIHSFVHDRCITHYGTIYFKVTSSNKRPFHPC